MSLLKMVLIHGYINIQMDGIIRHGQQVVMFASGDHVVSHPWMLVKVELFGNRQIVVQHAVLFGHLNFILFNLAGMNKPVSSKLFIVCFLSQVCLLCCNNM
jgi:hypothetical protein